MIFVEELKIDHKESLSRYISFLPYEDLSNLAEALINITSFKMKIRDGLETICGPIDVMLIIKGTGIWTKQKKFFNKN